MAISTHQQFKHLTLLIGLVCVQPLFVLVIKGWSSGILILAGVTCLIVIVASNLRQFDPQRNVSMGLNFRPFLLSYSLLFVSICVSGLLSNNLDVTELDSPSRFLIAIPIFIWLRHVRVDTTQTLILSVTLGLIVTLVSQTFFPSEHPWHATRMSNQFADPLSFGYITLSFALTSLISLFYAKSQPVWLMTLKGVSCCAGFYMSVLTESRSGWFAVPLVLIFLLLAKRKHLMLREVALYLIIVLGTAIAAYSFIERIHSRISEGINDLSGYSFQGIAPDTSLGLRITFLRIAYDMVSERPLAGFGNTQRKKPEVPKIVKTYASTFAIDFALSSGFHNEIITNAVHHGLMAAIASLLLFVVPLGIYWQSLRNSSSSQQHAAAVGIAFTLTFFVSSLSTEVFGLKYTASLYALITAVLCATTTQIHSETS